MPRFPSAQGRLNHEPGFHLSCDENLSEGWGPPPDIGACANYRKCSHLTGMLVVLSAVRKKGGPKRPPLCIAQVLRITLSQRLVQRTPIERLVAALERITGRPFSLGHHALAAEKFIPLAQAFVRFNIYAKRNEIVFSVLVFANEYR